MNFSSAPALVLGPVFADAIFHRGSQGLGLILGTFGIGRRYRGRLRCGESSTKKLPTS
jgi:hypothetical protein